MKLNSIFSALCVLLILIIFGCSDGDVTPEKAGPAEQGVMGPPSGIHIPAEGNSSGRLDVYGTIVRPVLSGRVLRSVAGTFFSLKGAWNKEFCLGNDNRRGFAPDWTLIITKGSTQTTRDLGGSFALCLSEPDAGITAYEPVTQRTTFQLMVTLYDIGGGDYGTEVSNTITVNP